MSKYNPLWEYVAESSKQVLKLTFEEIQNIVGIPIDHSFLKYKKELADYGYEVIKISMKEQTVDFKKIDCGLTNGSGTGIIVCGLNGSGKSTLGKALADKLGFCFIDNEDLYFSKTDPDYLYASARTHEEVEKLLISEVNAHKDFVFASVKGDHVEAFYPFIQYAVLIDVPKDIRIQRVRNRSFQKFGNRMLPGGDLYEQEEQFFAYVESRSNNTVEEWLQSLKCTVIRVDGTKPIEQNVDLIIKQLKYNFTKESRSGIKSN